MASKKRKARITLIGPMTLAVGRFRFHKDRPVVTDEEDLIKYCEHKTDFRVVFLKDEKKETAPKSNEGSQSQQPVNTPDPAPTNEGDDQTPEDENQTDENQGTETVDENQGPQPVSDEDFLDDSAMGDLDLDDDGLVSNNEPGTDQSSGESPKRLTRKP